MYGMVSACRARSNHFLSIVFSPFKRLYSQAGMRQRPFYYGFFHFLPGLFDSCQATFAWLGRDFDCSIRNTNSL